MSRGRYFPRVSLVALHSTVVLASLPLAGCGFQPLYGQVDGGQPQIAETLQNIYVANIPERNGQQLRLALQENLGGASSAAPEGYTLRVSPGFSSEYIDIHSDNTSGRVRELASAHWQLYTVEQAPKLVAQGDASTLDGMNTQFEQYFAQTMNHETAQARMAKTLANEITQQIATWFRSHVTPPKANKKIRERYFNPNAMPGKNGAQYDDSGPDGFPAAATGRRSNGILD
ncbi:hypothetical protein [Brytella acorum]|uniref:Lipoprotein n=1 Tax=Brytella acorum TaxID=2959299 RepID=A0AA35Y2S8_9PROT|nr:hypothetical protein [Brytella acorum]MDF3624838.1 hypothetical protein [Brytella acorum]CAI9120141.1 hypothetical protein LMG32879_000970 [Brytella acorum]